MTKLTPAGAGLPADVRRAAGQLVPTLKLLANKQRLLLVAQLAQGELAVADLEQRLAIRQPTLSQQLAVLRGRGVVHTRREGKHVFYSLRDGAVRDAVRLLLTREEAAARAPAV